MRYTRVVVQSAPDFARENPRIACIRCNSTGFSGSLVHIGNVGTGLTDRQRRELREKLVELEQPISPFAIEPPRAVTRNASWSRPFLVCDVEYREFTGGSLRHPSFRGLRDDKTADEVDLPGRH
ncbi:ATP dependent DNA ligase [Rhodococcus erythropolis]|uniref:ATP dependent DNA ligase n=1 Tax=Rhodococcus erythropolis TaxID=1833 RepID=UPI003FD8BCF5